MEFEVGTVPAGNRRKISADTISKPRTILYHALALLLGPALLLVVLTFVELGLQIFHRSSSGTESQGARATIPARAGEYIVCDRDSVVGWIFPPMSRGVLDTGPNPTPVQTNRWGLRSPDIDPTDSTSLRILVLGDSHAFGWGIPEEDAFPRQLEKMIRKRYPQVSIDVVNAGILGYSIYQQGKMLELLLPALKVDIVISSFSLSNDVVDEVRVRRALPSHFENYSSQPRDPRSLLSRLVKRSYVLTWIDKRTQALQFQLINTGGKGSGQVRESLEDLISSCQERHIPLLLIVSPHQTEVCARGFKRKIGELFTQRARRLYKDVTREESTPVLDITDVLRQAQNVRSVYLHDDPHWNAEGHRVVAEAILNALPPAWLTKSCASGEVDSVDRAH